MKKVIKKAIVVALVAGVVIGSKYNSISAKAEECKTEITYEDYKQNPDDYIAMDVYDVETGRTDTNYNISVNAQSLNEEALKTIEYGKTIRLDVPAIFEHKMTDKNYAVTVSNKSVISAKKVGNTVVIKGKKAGTAKLVFKCGKNKKILKYIVAPKGFSIKQPKVSVKRNVKQKGYPSMRYTEIKWNKIKGATGYKVYTERLTKKGTHKKCIYTIIDKEVTSLYIPYDKNYNMKYYVQAYKEYKGKIYYGYAGYNTEVLK